MNSARLRTPVVSALVVGTADPDQAKLEAIFRGCGCKLRYARTRQEAREILESNPVGVVVAESDVEEGGWREMLDDLQQRPDPPLLVVTARLADESLWAEALNMGAYDVLAKPLDAEEVARVIGAALRHFENERPQTKPQTSERLLIAAAS